MTRRRDDESLDEVLEAYAASSPGPGEGALAEWAARYPQFARELAAFTAEWHLLDMTPPEPQTPDVRERVLERGMRGVREALREELARRPAPAEPLLASILKEAAARGLTRDALAEATELSPAIVQKLERRLIRFESIPRRAVDAVAHALGRPFSDLASYLSQGPVEARVASYHADRAPSGPRVQDFAEAVRDDAELTEEQQAAWLREVSGRVE